METDEFQLWFALFAGVGEIDYTKYPDKEFQSVWLRSFLEQKYENQGRKKEEVTERDIDILYVQVNKFVLVSIFSLKRNSLANIYGDFP